ncbi:MAG: putative periplasmic or secreted lipoprotein [Micavibrio sp.]|nr:putative periplasmic or secreted lipoprotein [Micavibrio sp.]
MIPQDTFLPLPGLLHMKKFFVALPVVLIGFGLSSCSPIGMAAGAGATLGIASAKEGGISGAATDMRIKTLISEKWFSYKVDTFRKLNLTVDQGRVLITGIVQNPDDRVEAVRLAWQVSGVKQVINEIRVADGEGVSGYVRDTWITTRLRTAMTFDKDVQAINYSIDTVDGTVYLMGVAKSQKDLDRAVSLARTIPGVKQVVTYVKPAGQAVANDGTGSNTAPAQAQPPADPYAPVTSDPYAAAPAYAAPTPVYTGTDPYATTPTTQYNDPYASGGNQQQNYMTPSASSGTSSGGLGVAPVSSAPLSPPGR